MRKLEVLTRLNTEKIMAIIRVENFERAVEIVEGCLTGGVSCLEISYTNANAGEIIKKLKDKYQDRVLIGAGTVLDSETALQAVQSGAEFMIAPNFSLAVAKTCNRYQVPYMPGCTTMTEIVVALEAGADMIKIFPNSALIGPKIISTIRTPMPYVPLLSSGGVTPDNIDEWVKAGVNCMGVGTLLSKGTTKEIAENAKLLKAQIK